MAVTMSAVHQAVYTALSTALAGVATVYDDVPPDAAYPYVDMSAQNRLPNGTLDEQHHIFEFYPTIFSQYRGGRELRDMQPLLDAALDRQHLTLADGTRVFATITDFRVIADGDGATYNASLTINIRT